MTGCRTAVFFSPSHHCGPPFETASFPYGPRRTRHSRRCRACASAGFRRCAARRCGSIVDLAGHHPTRAERMDLLGRVRQEARDPAQAHRLGPIQPERRKAPALLLAGLPAPLNYAAVAGRPCAIGCSAAPDWARRSRAAAAICLNRGSSRMGSMSGSAPQCLSSDTLTRSK